MSDKKERSDNLAERGVLYTQIFEHLKKAENQGFYLETITLYESLISDRLESRISYLEKKENAFKSLERNLEEIRKCETDEKIKELTQKGGSLDSWKNKRNFALHEFAKLKKSDSESFSEKYSSLKDITDEGLKLFRELDSQITKLRKQNEHQEKGNE